MSTDGTLLFFLLAITAFYPTREFLLGLSNSGWVVMILCTLVALPVGIALAWWFFSKSAREYRKRLERVSEIPTSLKRKSPDSVSLGAEQDLKLPIYLPDRIRSRHVHILGATGSGKTESVIFNLLKQDVERGLGAIILDAKGDASFLAELGRLVPATRLSVFDLGAKDSLGYDPLSAGGSLEAAQRLFSSLVWSEEYYKSKAFSAIQRLFEVHRLKNNRNPSLVDLRDYLETEADYSETLESKLYPAKLAAKDFQDLSGLRDQIRGLTVGHLATTLSPQGSQVRLESAWEGQVIYFRLQSLLSQQLVSTVGKLLINHLSLIAGSAHRRTPDTKEKQKSGFLPVYLDEFASFACPEFADLISKARSAGMALHFSHQSVGDLTEVSPGFLSRINDNSATKIVLRINDPDSAELMSRTFGTSLYQKLTQRVTKVTDPDLAELVGEGTQREAHQFRASPDLLKTLPTGAGAVLIAHGEETPHGASSVFRIRFPRLQISTPTQTENEA